MRYLFVAFLSLFFTSSISFAQEKTEPDPDPKTFKEAYAGYQKYEEPKKGNDWHFRTHYAEKAYDLGLIKYGKNNKNTNNLLLNWVYAYTEHNKNHKSPVRLFNTTFTKKNNYQNIDTNLIINAYMEIGKSYLVFNGGKYLNRTERNFLSALSLSKRQFGSRSKEFALLNISVGQEYYSKHLGRKAHKYFYSAEEILSNKTNAQDETVATSKFWLGKTYLSKKNYKQAGKKMGEALTYLDKKHPNGKLTLTSHAFMVNILEKQGKSEEANKHCQYIGSLTPFVENQQQVPIYQYKPVFINNSRGNNKKNNTKVVMKYTIDENGIVRNAEILESTGLKAFKKFSLETLAQYRFAPRFENGQPIKTENLKYTFHLKNN